MRIEQLSFEQQQSPWYIQPKEKENYMNRVALSFNFNLPETLIIENGALKRWYYSNAIG